MWHPAHCTSCLRTPLSLAHLRLIKGGFPGGSAVRNPPANARDTGSSPGSGRAPGEGNASPLQCSCLGNPRDRGAWWATSIGSQRGGHDSVTEQQQHPPENVCRLVLHVRGDAEMTQSLGVPYAQNRIELPLVNFYSFRNRVFKENILIYLFVVHQRDAFPVSFLSWALFWRHRAHTSEGPCPCPPGLRGQCASPRGATAPESSLQRQIVTTRARRCPAAPESIASSLLRSLPFFTRLGSDDECLPSWKSIMAINLSRIMGRIDVMISLSRTQHCLGHPALGGPDTLEQWKVIVSRGYTFHIC